MKTEKRYFEGADLEFRAIEEDDKRYLEGYAALYNQRSNLLFEDGKLFTEIIERGAFDKALEDDNLNVIFNMNHNDDNMIARTASGTLQISTDDKGLKFRAEIPNTTLANDVYELVNRGDLFSNSFAFNVTKEGQLWKRDEDGNTERRITEIKRLFDVSVVTNAAYPNTEIAARALKEVEEEKVEEVEEQTPPDNKELYERKLKLRKRKI